VQGIPEVEGLAFGQQQKQNVKGHIFRTARKNGIQGKQKHLEGFYCPRKKIDETQHTRVASRGASSGKEGVRKVQYRGEGGDVGKLFFEKVHWGGFIIRVVTIKKSFHSTQKKEPPFDKREPK